MNDFQTAIATTDIRLAGTNLRIEKGEEILVDHASNQPANFTKYFARPASDPGSPSILIEREDFHLVTDGIIWNKREREDREAARLYRAHCVWNGGEIETTVGHFHTPWKHDMLRQLLLTAVARHAQEFPEVQFRKVNISSFIDWQYRRVGATVHNGFGGITHWDCSLRNLVEVPK